MFIHVYTLTFTYICRYLVKYPESIPGIFKEIEACHVNPKTAPFTVLCSAMSLAGGASLGPEQALVRKCIKNMI